MINLIIPVISAALAYFFAVRNEVKKSFSSMSMNTLNGLLSELYFMFIDLKNQNDNSNPNFINNLRREVFSHLSHEESITAFYNDKLIEQYINFSILLKSNSSKDEIVKKFESLGDLIEQEYWKTLSATSQGYKWRISSANLNVFHRIILSAAFTGKEILEYCLVSKSAV